MTIFINFENAKMNAARTNFPTLNFEFVSFIYVKVSGET